MVHFQWLCVISVILFDNCFRLKEAVHDISSHWSTSDVLQVCVTREVDRESSQLSHGMVVRAGLCDGAWHHLALCIPTINVRKGGNLKVWFAVWLPITVYSSYNNNIKSNNTINPQHNKVIGVWCYIWKFFIPEV